MKTKIISMAFSIPEIEDLESIRNLLELEYNNTKDKYKLCILKIARDFINSNDFKYISNSIVQIFIVNNVSHIYNYVSDGPLQNFYRLCVGDKITYNSSYISIN